MATEIPLSPFQKVEENKVMKKVTKRMKCEISTIHLARDLLNPSSQGCHLQPENIQKYMANNRQKKGLWKRTFIWEGITGKVEKENQVGALLWWRQLRGTCVLDDVAIRILGVLITSSATERTLSTFSWIHNKRRNRLTTNSVQNNKAKRKPSEQEVDDKEELDEPRPLAELLSNDSLLESEGEPLEAIELETKDLSSESD
ncbi:hypothetical protein J6590_000362 [Homalodisca vitripennis]|nr:hypothetical protein J6590_000362 [Homalodisca vitripennis]